MRAYLLIRDKYNYILGIKKSRKGYSLPIVEYKSIEELEAEAKNRYGITVSLFYRLKPVSYNNEIIDVYLFELVGDIAEELEWLSPKLQLIQFNVPEYHAAVQLQDLENRLLALARDNLMLTLAKDNNESYSKMLPRYLYKYVAIDSSLINMLTTGRIVLNERANINDINNELFKALNEVYDYNNNSLRVGIIELLFKSASKYTTKEGLNKSIELVNSTIENGRINKDKLFSLYAEIAKLYNGYNIKNILDDISLIDYEINSPELILEYKNKLKEVYDYYLDNNIASFTTSYDNLELWNKYGKAHRGVILELELKGYSNKDRLYPVLYNSAYGDGLGIALYDDLNFNTYYSIKNSYKNDDYRMLDLFRAKNECYKYQEEWLIIGENNDELELPKIKRVIIGRNASNEDKTQLISLCKGKKIKYEIL